VPVINNQGEGEKILEMPQLLGRINYINPLV